eukprot:1956769-Pleurochrysis_carterae.AAC.1
MRDATERHMVEHSNDGLRTLVVASKQLDPKAYAAWSAKARSQKAHAPALTHPRTRTKARAQSGRLTRHARRNTYSRARAH